MLSISRSGCCGIATIFLLISIALYFAFAFPYSLFQLKQTETTEIKSVIVIARNGEKSPKLESYFIGEEPPEELEELGYDQLTNVGKERMYLLGKFLRMRYYHLLLNGNPRKLSVRSSDTDRCLESAQTLLAGLNPPRDSWFWSSNGELENWQPKAIHTTSAYYDDLLAEEPNCYSYEEEVAKWKNSSKYLQHLNEFRHDLQTLRSNTGLEFEDDLEIVSQIDDSLKTRKAFKENAPAWYTATFASRLSHIADVSTEERFKSANMQRLYIGRLLQEIAGTVNAQIMLHQQSLTSSQSQQFVASGPAPSLNAGDRQEAEELARDESAMLVDRKELLSVKAVKTRLEPNMFIYMTNKQKLSALLDSLGIYSSQPPFGALLLIEIHYDPINNLHFLRLYSVSSANPNVLPEPLRLNPTACQDSAECAPEQFEQNVRHLMLDRASWEDACLNSLAPSTTQPSKLPLLPLINENSNFLPLTTSTTTEAATLEPTTTAAAEPPTTTPSGSTTTTTEQLPELEKLDESLIVGPAKSTTTELATENRTDADKVATTEPTTDVQPEEEVVSSSSTEASKESATASSSTEADIPYGLPAIHLYK